MPKERISGKNISRAITSDDILGKEVIDAEGKIIGITEKLFLDPETLDFVGIEVDKGFLKKGLSIGRDYIERVSSVAVFLRITIAFDVRGRMVFDRVGAKIGKVSQVELKGNKNQIQKLIVRLGVKRKIGIPLTFVETMDRNVILGISKEQLLDYVKQQKSK